MRQHRSARSARALIVLLIALIVVIAIAGWAYWFFLLRGPLAGDTSHSFGTVQLTAPTVTLEHVFQLRNRTSGPITIHAIKPDCGCVTAKPPATAIAPAAMIELPITMVVRAEERNVRIQLDLGEAGRQNLWLRAHGVHRK